MNDDIQLIERIRKGDVNAVEELMEKYKALVNKLSRVFFIKGEDIEDIAQEGMIALYNAVLTYDTCSNIAFSTYATSCIRNRITDYGRHSKRNKNKPLTDSVPISVLDDRKMAEQSPEDIAIRAEEDRHLRGIIENGLSPDEKQILDSYYEGMSYREIADKIGKKTKYVDNVLQKIKRKKKKDLDK